MSKKLIKIAEFSGKHLIFLPVYLAIKSPDIQQNYEVQISKAGNDDDIFNAVNSGKADFGIGDPSVIIGSQAKTIASVVSKPALWGYTHYSEIDQIMSAKDLAALRLGIYPSPSTAYCLLKNFTREIKTTQLVENNIDTMLSKLAAGEIEIAIDIEPLVSIAEDKGLFTVLNFAELMPNIMFTGLYCLNSTVKQAKEFIQILLNELQSILKEIYTNPVNIINLAQELFPNLDADICVKAIQRMITSQIWPESCMIEIRDWLNLVRIRESLQFIPKESNYLSYIDNSFAINSLSITK